MDDQPPTIPDVPPAAAEVADRVADEARDRRRERLIAILVGLTVIACAVGGWQIYQARSEASQLSGQVAQLDHRADSAESGERKLATQVTQLGARPVVQPPPSGTAVPAAPTQQEIDVAVARYLDAHPVPGATPAMVAVQVAQYLTAHPPVPSPGQIATAAADYIGAHADQFRGPTGQSGQNGKDGKPGADATDAQVESAVDAFCSAHGNCAGPPGTPGKDGAQGFQGVSITNLRFQRDATGACQVVVTLHDPASGADSTLTSPAGDAACPLLTPPSTGPNPQTTHGR